MIVALGLPSRRGGSVTLADADPLPCLDFGDWRVAFPPRGQHSFLPSHALTMPQDSPPDEDESGIWLARAESGASLAVPVRIRVLRNGLPVVALAALHHGDRLEFAGHRVGFHEVRRTHVAAGSRLVDTRCSQCHTPLGAGTAVVACPLCGGVYHDDCWHYLADRRCYSRSCNFSPGPVEPEPWE
ncbi:hypothetical protein [Dactylosporangium sp. CA-233914]|uniref:hypothetical protein n=1 Tax=Dactylosporangium sp. CA-233914 TaxID=3239934 RepID=UPI003D8D6B17